MKNMIHGLLNSYAIVFFSQNRWLGALLLAVTMVAPQFGLAGLAGLVVAYVTARLLGFDESQTRKGIYLFNSLLVSLALAYLQNYHPLSSTAFAILLVAASMITLFISVFLNDVLLRQYALPALSFPFVWVAFALFFLFFSFTSTPIVSTPPTYLFAEPGWMPEILVGFFQALGAIFFLPHVGVGLIIFTILLCWSRLAVLYAVIGYSAGVGLMHGLGMDTVPSALTFAGFNYIFCAIALGGIFFIPSRGSLVLAVLGAVFCVASAVAVKTFLQFFSIPPLALPLNLVVLLVLYVMRCRTRVHRLFCTPFAPERPEQNFRRFYTDTRRFPDLLLPHLYLPFCGERTITQGVDGRHTHRGEWREALDFEVVNGSGHRFSEEPTTLDNSFVFDTPVLAPCSGFVAKVVNDVPDNAVGTVNTDRNWGNTVILQSDAGWFVTLSHLRQESVVCRIGERVVLWQMIGRCGNSGRSPVPHLHVQVQRTGQLGDRTIPFRIAHYLTIEGDQKHYRTSGLPSENETLQPVVFDDQVGACFEFGENTWHYQLDGQPETIRCTINVQGDYELESVERKTRLTARIREHTFFTLDYRGGRDSVLFYFWIGLCRVPFVRDAALYWNDHLDLRPLLKTWVAASFDFIGPFSRYPLANITSRAVGTETALVTIETDIGYSIPEHLLKGCAPHNVAIRLNADGIIGATIHENGCERQIKRIEASFDR